MKILIVGGNSSLSKFLKPVLSESGEVLTAGRTNCDITLDLKDNISLPDDLDAIIHTAAHPGGKTKEEILEAENVNVLGTLKLCRSAVEHGCKHLILISSIYIHLKEDSSYYSIYSISKKQAEEVAKFYCSKNSLPLTILRPSQIYGNFNNLAKHQPFLNAMIEKAQRDEDITIYGTNNALKNYIYIDDVTTIISKVIQYKIEGEYDCCNVKDIDCLSVALAALGAFGGSGNVYFSRYEPSIPDNVFEKDNSLYEKINFYPRTSIEDGLKKIANSRKISK